MKNEYYLPSLFQPNVLPIVGFILQKDVYTTNLLYANDQFSTKSLRKKLPFRSGSGRKPNNPSSSLTILRQNGLISENSEDETIFYTRNTFKPKKLHHKHLRFPLPKLKAIPLTNSILHEDICKQDIKIKYMDDDLNITSKFGKKIIYNLKESHTFNKKLSSKIKFSNQKQKKIANKSNNRALLSNKLKKYRSEYKFGKFQIKKRNNQTKYNDKNDIKNTLPMRQAIYQINSELKIIQLEEKERKKSFYRNKFFTTQINTQSNNDSTSNKNKSIYEPIKLH